MREIIVIFTLVSLLTGCTSKKRAEHAHYQVDVNVKPSTGQLHVKGTFFVPQRPDSSIFTFYLHKQLNMSRFAMNGNDNVKIQQDSSQVRYMPEALKYELQTNTDPDSPIELAFEYQGKITDWPGWSPSVLSADWSEMGLYFPWFPYSFDIEQFTYDVNIQFPDKYHAFMLGNRQVDANTVRFSVKEPTNDMVLCASPDLKISDRKVGTTNAQVAYVTLSDTVVDTLMTDVEQIISKYNEWFPPMKRSFCIVESLRDKGGGYARTGGVYLAGFKDASYMDSRTGYIRYLSHEIAHFWWKNADSKTWHDWLNEGFAEYAALAMVRELAGEEAFERRCRKKEEKCKESIPVWEFDRNGKQASTVLYAKTPLLLFALERKVGEEAFRDFMKQLLRKKTTTTNDFLAKLETHFDSSTKQWFISKLKSAGPFSEAL